MNARQLLQTIVPNAKTPQMPPGFSPLDGVSTERFRYKTTDQTISVTANLQDDEVVELFPGQITVSDIKLKFLHEKKESKKDWNVSIKGDCVLILNYLYHMIS